MIYPYRWIIVKVQDRYILITAFMCGYSRRSTAIVDVEPNENGELIITTTTGTVYNVHPDWYGQCNSMMYHLSKLEKLGYSIMERTVGYEPADQGSIPCAPTNF